MVVLRAKLIVAGDSCTGKTALTQVFHSDGTHYPKNYTMTIGAEVLVKVIHIPETQDSVELYMIDSAGKEMFADTVQQYWENPDLLLVVYDVSNEHSFNACNKWLERCRAMSSYPNTPGALIGTKTDLKQRRSVSGKEGKEFASSKNLEYFECSAKEHQNVEAPFYYLAQEFHKLYQEKLDSMKALS
ncbi:intraflagellar transport protein 27 homolog isoform X1 [Exaiptasia diaphana]|uniref:Intraflagellar transport protein 27 homolog n=1 Tax=Exaiptasia diaphana TaxID=2652724 RepID=A0A913XZT6_EXADI|nr:intraflagellar transport protein 27 homolog isoform X1 [Exaiptasia diaphana]KXJ07765.1 Intraflagellar transport protein 27-like [Exaiptasia diaphana]